MKKYNPKAILSDRVRPDCEAAPWVVDEIKEMESTIKELNDIVDELSKALKLSRDMFACNDMDLPHTFRVIDEALEKVK